jgi:hypothetical protein
MKNIVLIPFIFIAIVSFDQKETISLVETDEDYYQWITFLSEGEISWVAEPIGEVEGISFRLIITTSDIYNNIYIEKITYGMEGCCKKIVYKKEIPLSDIFKRFKLNGERSGVEFVKWLNPTSFELKIYDDIYRIWDIDKSKIAIEKNSTLQ